ncbi:MAG: mechanosensitive ion channel family protein [Cyclobacteriaceae bacterium]|nr:mechanosensitive ion channel family protein [Cyclobacteriaceae bacterium]
MQDFLKREYYGNDVEHYLITLAIIFGGLLLLRIMRKSILRKIKDWTSKTETQLDDYLVRGIEKFGLPILNYVVIYFAIRYLVLPEHVEKLIRNAIVVIFTFYGVRMISSFARLSLEAFIKSRHEGEEKLKQLGGIMLVINIILWGIGLLFIFTNLGYDVTAIVAGLGIGGIAIALAAQNILGDLFNYFVIFFDRPFEIGDFVAVDDKKGTVEYIGIKTTRLKSITGEQLVFSNSDLTNSRIHNFKRMERRRIIFSLGVVYQTPPQLLEKIPTIIKDIIAAQPKVTFDRAHFSKFGASSLDYEIVYFVETSEYNQYMDLQQKINMQIFHAFAAEKIEFAYPTQTLFLTKESNED